MPDDHSWCDWAQLDDRKWRWIRGRFDLSPSELSTLRAMLLEEKLCATARRMGVAEGTLKTYRQRVFRKLAVETAMEVVQRVLMALLDSGLVEPLANRGKPHRGIRRLARRPPDSYGDAPPPTT
jgi:DNA-binding CsgD family transcriptional regulator